ncbi:hypothetical protein MRX96_017012 [Rhipicephalus microplus]
MPRTILGDPLLLSELKWSEMEDLLVFVVLNERRRDPLSSRGLLNVDAMDDDILKDLEDFFGRRSSTISSLTAEVFRHIDEKFFHLLDDVNHHSRLTIDTLENFSKAIYTKGAQLTNCWGSN